MALSLKSYRLNIWNSLPHGIEFFGNFNVLICLFKRRNKMQSIQLHWKGAITQSPLIIFSISVSLTYRIIMCIKVFVIPRSLKLLFTLRGFFFSIRLCRLTFQHLSWRYFFLFLQIYVSTRLNKFVSKNPST